MPISRVFVARFFQLILKRRFAEAERVLERISGKIKETEWNRGYLQALSGILLAQKSTDPYAFLSKIDLNDTDLLKTKRREFLKEARDKIQEDYDRGFFAAWADYMRISIQSHEETKTPQ